MRALTVGGAMVDTIAIVDDVLIERMSMSNAGKTFLLLEQGSKTEASSISTHCGGGAINAGVGLARLGYEVTVLAKVGEDARAELVRQKLASEGIGAQGLRVTEAAPTGSSAIISAHDRNAAIFTFRGANTLLTQADIEPALFDTDLVYISTLSGGSADLLPHLLQQGAPSTRFAVNPGVRQITTRFHTVSQLLPQIGILAVNRLEAEAFVRQAVAEIAGSENLTLRRIAAASLKFAYEADGAPRSDVARALIGGLIQLGAQTVLLTDGRHGAYVGSEREVLYCPALEVPVVSSAGAGDAFASTFAGVWAELGDAASALIAATVNASAVVTQVDSQSGLLCADELALRVLDVRGQLDVQRFGSG